MKPGNEIGIKIDQTLTQDATGTLIMLELEAMHLDRVKTEVSAQYVDHNLIQEDHKNPDDHLFLESACEKFGLWFSRPGNGVSHPLHMAKFGIPGKTLLGSDSHTCAAGSLGMLAIGAGGLEVALAMSGEPFYFKMPRILGVKLTGKLPPFVSAKDVILELLRRRDVSGGIGLILEYYGPGLESLSAMDRHVIANMGAELGATTSVFPSDEQTRRFLKQQGRESAWKKIEAGQTVKYDLDEEIDLSELEPLIAKPSSPGNVVPVSEVEGEKIYQAYIGSSANPGYRDFAIAAEMVRHRTVADQISFDINPSSREILENLIQAGYLQTLVHAEARIHQAGCNGCIGMGQAPATGKNSMRTVPRNFPGRSGTKEDSVWLCSPETATASALKGVITDPRKLGIEYPEIKEPENWILNRSMWKEPLPREEARTKRLIKGPNIGPFPEVDPIPDTFELPILLKVGDNISTDTILPAGARVLPYRSNIAKISEFVFESIAPDYAKRAQAALPEGHAVVGGDNYGQGSSREHAALAPRSLGLKVVLVKRFARIHMQNLVNFGILPLVFTHEEDYARLNQGDVLQIEHLHEQLEDETKRIRIKIKGKNREFEATHQLTSRQVEILLAGGVIRYFREKNQNKGIAKSA